MNEPWCDPEWGRLRFAGQGGGASGEGPTQAAAPHAAAPGVDANAPECVRLEQQYGTFLGHPKGLLFLFLSEMWERFSYYGMRALLIFYLLHGLHFDGPRAGSIFGLYTGGAYLTGILGGFVADHFTGQRRALIMGGVIMAAGHFLMCVQQQTAFFVALVLIALGTGFFKPNTTCMVGSLYRPGDPRREAGYSLYYMGINVGSLAAMLICGYLGQRVGWHWGFGAAGVGMVLGLVSFTAGRRHFGSLGDRPAPAAARTPALAARPRLTRTDKRRMLAIVLLALLGNIVFFATFEQAGSSLSLFAEGSTRLQVLGLNASLPASWVALCNPLFIILLSPVVGGLWTRLTAANLAPSVPVRIALGLLFVAAGFGVMVRAGHLFEATGPVSVLWLVSTFFLHTVGEIISVPAGYSMVARLAPRGHASSMMAVWFATIALANWLGGRLAGEYLATPKGAFFMVPAFFALAAGALLLLVSKPIAGLMHDSVADHAQG